MGLILDICTTMYVVTQRGMVSRACLVSHLGCKVISAMSHTYTGFTHSPQSSLGPAMFLTLY